MNRRLASALLVVLACAGAGCANLPSSGPTAQEIVRARGSDGSRGFDLVELTAASVDAVAGPAAAGSLAALARSAPIDRIGPGDVLQITVFEVGAALFSGNSGQAAEARGYGASPGAAGVNFPLVTVEQDGSVLLPYIGPVQAAGRTPGELQALIATDLKGKSQAPQVIVYVRENVANTIVVMGDVKKPGRLPLTLAGDRLLDAIAAAEGGAYPTQDLIVRVSRGGRSAAMRLDAIEAGQADDIPLVPQDRIEVLYRPRSFTVLGATKVAETAFQAPRVSLAEAVARAGGPLDQQADPTAVFVFRYDLRTGDDAPAAGARPTVYRLDLMRPESYFVAQRFEMRPRDLIYIANARVNQLTKLVQILNLFFSPAYTAKVISQP